MPGITFEKVKNIFDLLQTFNLNFVVVHDRIESDYYSIEELKEVFQFIF